MITSAEASVQSGTMNGANKPVAGSANGGLSSPSQPLASPQPLSSADRKSIENPQAGLGVLRKLRVLQIRTVATLLIYAGRISAGRSLILFARSIAFTRWILEFLLGYRRSFHSFAEAQRCCARYINAGHEHEDDIRMHLSSSRAARESDYPVFFFLSQSAQPLRGVFDFGGNIGNLFYCYQQYLPFPEDISWKIYDLPELREAGEKLAAERGESRIRYVESLASLESDDLFLASGCLHYFDSTLAELLSQAPQLPRRIVVNRTAFSDGGDVITVQDNGSFLVPCKLHHKQKFLDQMAALGYKLRASWPVAERALYVPLHPDASSSTYFGFYFELDSAIHAR